jgi:peptide/nickel transport system permease protein
MRSLFAVIRDLFRYNREFTLGAILILIVAGTSIASFFSPYASGLQYVVPFDTPPSWEHILGTNSRGQDVFWQLTFAIRNSLLFGITVALISRIISLFVGLTAGYLGGTVDRVLMSINDTFVTFPPFPILVLVYFIFKDHMSWALLAVAMASLGWPYDARLIRSVAMSLRTREFTTQSVFSGMSTWQILSEDHLPYVLPIVFATTMNNINWSIGLEVTLSVIGFTNIDTPTIGTMIYWANQHTALVSGVWWWIAAPVAIVIMTFIGLYLLSVSMNEYIDPRSRLARMEGAR